MSKPDVEPYTPGQIKIANAVIPVMSKLNTWFYQISNGKLGGRFLQGAPVCLLTTIGRKSGKPRVAPLIYITDGDDVVLVASKGGMPTHPLWFLNLEANPEVEIQIGGETKKMIARRASEEEKKGYWPRLVEMYTDYDEYVARAAKATREIPVVILSPL